MEMLETRKKLLDLINEAVNAFSNTDKSLIDIVPYVAEYLTANGVIVPPCKVEGAVYWVGLLNQLVEGKVVGVEACFSAKVAGLDYEFKLLYKDIGKTVFLSREDAEKALKGVE